jgi:hypothetical protein
MDISIRQDRKLSRKKKQEQLSAPLSRQARCSGKRHAGHG